MYIIYKGDIVNNGVINSMIKEVAIDIERIEEKCEMWDMNLDYENKNNVASLFLSEGSIHPYPAKAVPDMVHDLMKKIKNLYDIKTVLDPFVGSGTTALEAKLLGLDFYGADLNPLAVLLAQTKSITITGTTYIKNKIEEFVGTLNERDSKESLYTIEKFPNIDYWFKPENIEELSYLKYRIADFLKKAPKRYKKTLSLIILTAFSATIRASSLTRNEEFKLYRLSPADIKKFNVNSKELFRNRIKTLLGLLQDVKAVVEKDTLCNIFLANAKNMKYMGEEKADLIITSPPYGDSQSTVAYGQFSRLSVQWMADLMKAYAKIDTVGENCDERLLGGRHSVGNYDQEAFEKAIGASGTLKKLIDDIEKGIDKELIELKLRKDKVLGLKNSEILNAKTLGKVLENDVSLKVLIKEKIRLYVYRKINQSIILQKKQIKKLALKETENIIADLINEKAPKHWKRKCFLQSLFPQILTMLNSKSARLQKRAKEVAAFFVDLYQVVQETNKVISKKGIQVWIVGHRTVLGNIEVKMADILAEWFNVENYEQLAIIKRNYHFKRLPHHINSTITRTQEVKTMMEEHILIVRKQYT